MDIKKNTRVLVIDDDDFILELISAMLQGMGFEDIATINDPELAFTTRSGLDICNIIFCDLNMPQMDGVEFIRFLANIRWKGALVLVSGEDTRILHTTVALAEAQGLKVLGALRKPIDAVQVRTILGDYVESAPDEKGAKPVMPLNHEDLRKAIRNKDLCVYFQPKVSIKNLELIGLESLVRWRHAEYGIIPPIHFIELAEKEGLINELAEFVVFESFRLGGEWYRNGLQLKIAVNLSLRNLTRLDFPEICLQAAKDAGLPFQNVVFEITETSLMQDFVTCAEILTRLRLRGAALSIDDFGTGYSSMEQLMRIPFVELKIDRAFVRGAGIDPAARAILDSSVALAKRLSMSIVAEGVEDRKDWDLVESLGIDQVQGYYVAKPIPADEIPDWAEDWKKNHYRGRNSVNIA